MRALFNEAVGTLRRLGAEMEEVSLPLLPIMGIVDQAGRSERIAVQWRDLMTRPRDYDPALRRSALVPGLLPAAAYQRAIQAIGLIRSQILDACQRYDVLISPTRPAPAPLIEATKKPLGSKEEAVLRLKRFSFNIPAALAATPAISVPCG